VEVAIASELRYGEPVLGPEVLTLAISQSGETADTLAALALARAAGCPTLALTNVMGSSLTRAVDATLYLQVGPEIGVVATKSFTAQLVLLALVAITLGRRRGTLAAAEAARLGHAIRELPEQLAIALEAEPEIAAVAKAEAGARSMFFLGRGYGYPVALEAALKLKEISYIHAEGYPAGELKHGPIAMLDPEIPVFAVATQSPVTEKVLSNIQEVRARGARVIALATAGDRRLDGLAEQVLTIPQVPDALSPIVAAVPAQLFAYHVARELGRDVDQPRNLAKSVTVE
jgi:glucosamine--fructose-6-phosphate aminotransferase (isomerizing)